MVGKSDNKPTRKKTAKESTIKRLQDITDHAIRNKILSIKVDGIEMQFHPSAFIELPKKQAIQPKKEAETPEERIEREKAQLEDDLFWSAG